MASLPIVECIPNFSEGRRPEVIEAILQSIRSVAGAHILDVHSDPDHNRTVVTMAGAAQQIEQAAFAAIACAAARIDLTRHQGVHPRIGSTDVVPFVPLRGSRMEDCIALARQLGRRTGTELGIPVYLYGEAAFRKDRRHLEAIRKGQFEGLQKEIGTDPARKPDFGPAKIGPSGATAIGARGPLIAFNIYLDSEDMRIAAEIARAVRTSSGGLPCVKAIGILVKSRAQVSMNLTDYTQTSPAQAFTAVQREAESRGSRVAGSEIVGLIPEAALSGTDIAFLRVENFTPDRILERSLQAHHLDTP